MLSTDVSVRISASWKHLVLAANEFPRKEAFGTRTARCRTIGDSSDFESLWTLVVVISIFMMRLLGVSPASSVVGVQGAPFHPLHATPCVRRILRALGPAAAATTRLPFRVVRAPWTLYSYSSDLRMPVLADALHRRLPTYGESLGSNPFSVPVEAVARAAATVVTRHGSRLRLHFHRSARFRLQRLRCGCKCPCSAGMVRRRPPGQVAVGQTGAVSPGLLPSILLPLSRACVTDACTESMRLRLPHTKPTDVCRSARSSSAAPGRRLAVGQTGAFPPSLLPTAAPSKRLEA
ncbi:hypothetical protein C8R46DRAFT_1236692 [Mycena filopes]|nr:hypothetical protein C8R46DRAFT_1236692 [Mycena filopes]